MCSTSDGDVDGIAGLPVCRLTPVHPAVSWVDVADDAAGAGAGAGGQGSPAGGAGSDTTLGRFPPHSPAGGVRVILAAQNDGVVPVELRPVGAHPETNCEEVEGGGEVQRQNAANTNVTNKRSKGR